MPLFVHCAAWVNSDSAYIGFALGWYVGGRGGRSDAHGNMTRAMGGDDSPQCTLESSLLCSARLCSGAVVPSLRAGSVAASDSPANMCPPPPPPPPTHTLPAVNCRWLTMASPGDAFFILVRSDLAQVAGHSTSHVSLFSWLWIPVSFVDVRFIAYNKNPNTTPLPSAN